MQRWQPVQHFSFLGKFHCHRTILLSTQVTPVELRFRREPEFCGNFQFCSDWWSSVRMGQGGGGTDRQGCGKKVVAKLMTNKLTANLFEIQTAWLLTNTFAKWLMSWCGETGAIFSSPSPFGRCCWPSSVFIPFATLFQDKLWLNLRHKKWLRKACHIFTSQTPSLMAPYISVFLFHES